MHDLTLTELSNALQQRKFSSVELTRHFLERIKRYDGQLNSVITLTEELALQQAQLADSRLQQGTADALTGIPILHKDIFCTKGIKTTCGSKMLDNFIAPYNATVIDKFESAGAVMLGKTNMDEFAMGSSNETSYYGAVKNPWDIQAVPGGSSGGSAAALAARLAPMATGTDTGGSIRQPAALCNLVGLKPTYGTVSRYGIIAYASSLDQAGPMTHTAEDAGLLLNAMAGFDGKDSTSLERPPEDYTRHLQDSLKGLRIGLPQQYFGDGLNADVAQQLETAIAVLKQLGATVKTVDLPNSHLSVPAYYIIAPAECSSNLSRFDGVRFGYRCENAVDLMDLYKRSRGEGFGAEVKRRIMIGTYALSAGYYDAYYLKAQQIRRLISNDFKQAFQEVDVLLSPTSPTPAFNIGEKVDDPVTMYLSDIYTIAINLAGIPALSIPAGFVQNRPIGLQLIGNYFSESRLLNIAHQYQQQTNWHQQIPSAFT
ncbi:Asp-tRNA(Asn)/Glu-tRNA(Gln) amidotransferase subunit GatA [Beggiatoa leptomitoformis]|uniref:Glutamyl-tRNA(Gln) amidotransferase subunit A n=1 Tax=Beggiatoa leptomitoformis TaxID=288004 RepID=A0A2N9YD57_9GAMM|nr:Asp-tRNA(Asn)/Glu-tRNA(Gln) amidotransferase subunit GatA [Beggiatoa leptomitoformis]ALG69164.1 Asp-tRNA(Asn)/Glu-tRNA(Gln) amidotransferase subunit GatA [Beggiatoa leptomitoformis]AUI68412.1 Asp-tRNA(Asn)/Glu-tRNA(Gln) amidotransferase subunit GatA [Beggiatoa leptomitoformis]